MKMNKTLVDIITLLDDYNYSVSSIDMESNYMTFRDETNVLYRLPINELNNFMNFMTEGKTSSVEIHFTNE